MRVRHYLVVVAAGALACGAVQAQSAATMSAADALQGPPVNGVCLLSRQAVFANAKVGKAATARLQQLAGGIQNRFESERAKLGDDARAFQQQAASLPEASRRSQAAALEQRAQALEVERQRDIRQLELTRVQVMGRIGEQSQPILASLFKAHGCGLLLDRNAVLGGNFDNDLTPGVVTALDAKITTLQFNLAPLPADTSTKASGNG